MERLEHARLGERILAPEQRLGLAADRVAQVLELEPVRVGDVELDSLGPAVSPHLDPRALAMPGIVEEQRPLAPDRLELVPLGERRPAVEQREYAVREAK